jgi:hypothetical protein
VRAARVRNTPSYGSEREVGSALVLVKV